MEYPTNSRVKLKEFPDYKVYVANMDWNNDQKDLDAIQNGTARVYPIYSWSYGYHSLDRMEPRMLVEREKNKWKALPDVNPPEGARIALSKNCRIPSTMLKKYTVVTSVSADAPDYYVVQRSLSPGTDECKVKLFVDEDNKVLIALSLPTYGTLLEQLPEDGWTYLPSLKESLKEWMPNIENFLPLDNNTIYDIVNTIGDVEDLVYTNVLPEDRIVPETCLFVGEESLNYDILKSCYMMLQSSDKEMREAALITLAQHDCHGYEDFLRWLFHRHEFKRDVFNMKPRNKPFKWLHTFVQERGNYNRFWGKSRTNGRRLVEDLTSKNVKWDNNAMVVECYYDAPYLVQDMMTHLN